MAANRISSVTTSLLATAVWVTNIDYAIFHYSTMVKHSTRTAVASP